MVKTRAPHLMHMYIKYDSIINHVYYPQTQYMSDSLVRNKTSLEARAVNITPSNIQSSEIAHSFQVFYPF